MGKSKFEKQKSLNSQYPYEVNRDHQELNEDHILLDLSSNTNLSLEMEKRPEIKSDMDENSNKGNLSKPTSTSQTELKVIKPAFIIKKKNISNLKPNLPINIGRFQTQGDKDEGKDSLNHYSNLKNNHHHYFSSISELISSLFRVLRYNIDLNLNFEKVSEKVRNFKSGITGPEAVYPKQTDATTSRQRALTPSTNLGERKSSLPSIVTNVS